MLEMSVRQARAQFAAAIAAAQRGERVTITKNGKAVAQLGPPAVPVEHKQPFDWEALDRLQEELGIPTPTPEASEWIEKNFDSERYNRDIWGDYYA